MPRPAPWRVAVTKVVIASPRPHAITETQPPAVAHRAAACGSAFCGACAGAIDGSGKPLAAVALAARVQAKGPSAPIRVVTPAQSGHPAAMPLTGPGGFPGPASTQATPRTATPASPPQATSQSLARTAIDPSRRTRCAVRSANSGRSAEHSHAVRAGWGAAKSGAAASHCALGSEDGACAVARAVVCPGEVRRGPAIPPGAAVVSAADQARGAPAPPAVSQAPVSGAPPGFTRRPLGVRPQGPAKPQTAPAPERRRGVSRRHLPPL